MSFLGSGPHVGSRVDDLLDGRLDGADETRLRQHVGSCSACASSVHEQQRVRAVLRAARLDQPGPTGELMSGLLAMGSGASSAAGADRVSGAGDATRRGPSVLLGAAVLGTVTLATAGVLGASALPVPGTTLVRWGGTAAVGLVRTPPEVRTRPVQHDPSGQPGLPSGPTGTP